VVSAYAKSGIAGLWGIPHPGKPRTHDERVRSRIFAVSRTSPPEHTGLSHWSSRKMAKYLKRHESIDVSHVFVADLWREHDLKPHRQDTFKLSNDLPFEGCRHRRLIPVPTCGCGGAVCGREVRVAGSGPYSAAASHDLRQTLLPLPDQRLLPARASALLRPSP
jgi:hypothetical protein